MSKKKKLTEKQLFKAKEEWLKTFYEEVKPLEFYRDIFPVGSFQEKGNKEDRRANGIAVDLSGERPQRRIVFDELDEIKELKGKEFVIISPVSYWGKNRTGNNARWMHAIAIDLDGVGMEQLWDCVHQFDKGGYTPRPTYIVNSGHGLHLYYVFERPVPLYKHLQKQIREMKYELTRKVWNGYSSYYDDEKDKQYQGVLQGFRMVGTQSKLGKRYIIKAFETGPKVTMEYLNSFLIDKSKAVLNFDYKSELTLLEAKQKYPEWYEERVVKGLPRKRWNLSRAVYDWWYQQIKDKVQVGHRYFDIMCLALYAKKCSVYDEKRNPLPVTYEELERDAYELLHLFDSKSTDDGNRFTEEDIQAALEMFNEDYITFPRREIEKISGIQIPTNKRNGRKQADHIKIMNFIRDMEHPNGEWRNKDGRPKGSGTKEHIVREYQEQNPDAKKAECIRDTGLNKRTVYKYWQEKRN